RPRIAKRKRRRKDTAEGYRLGDLEEGRGEWNALSRPFNAPEGSNPMNQLSGRPGGIAEQGIDAVGSIQGMIEAQAGRTPEAVAAYVPLDPAYPAERVRFMLEDSQAAVVIARGRAFAGRTVCLDADAAAIARESTENPAPSADGEDLAYLIYTSGSTGRPK